MRNIISSHRHSEGSFIAHAARWSVTNSNACLEFCIEEGRNGRKRQQKERKRIMRKGTIKL